MSLADNIAQSVNSPVRPHRRKRWVFLAFFVVLVSAAIAYYLYFSSGAQERLRRALGEADRIDPGWKWTELQRAQGPIADEENAMLHVLLSGQSLPQVNSSMHKLEESVLNRDPSLRLDEQLKKTVRETVDTGGAALANARRLADMPSGRYPHAFPNDIVPRLQWFCDEVYAVQQWLCFDLIERTQAGDSEGHAARRKRC